MRHWIAATLSALLVSGCGAFDLPSTTAYSIPNGAALDAAARGGLTDDVAAHPSVQLAAPKAFALTVESRPYLEALATKVEPQRQELAETLQADATVQSGLAGWERATNDARMSLLKRVATLQGQVMGCKVPTIRLQTAAAAGSGLKAVYDPGSASITVYSPTLARDGKLAAIAVMVHEMRHAAQYQLFQGTTHDADDAVLADAYEAAWVASGELGGEGDLSYGDYVHLNVEYDAFQTGHYVAGVLSGGTFQAANAGFVDVQYDSKLAPIFDVLGSTQPAGTALIGAVNRAQYNATHAAAVQPSLGRQRVDVSLPTGWRTGRGGRR